MTFEEKFWGKCEQEDVYDGCWNWTGAVDSEGYGWHTLPRIPGSKPGTEEHSLNRAVKAHRLAFFLHYGWYPELVCHECDNPSCCNPYHLFGADSSHNNKDTFIKGRNKTVRGSDGRFMNYYPVFGEN